MKSSHPAFSLLEMLIVFVILGFVCAIGIQAVTQLRDNAREQTVLSRIKQLDMAKEQYISENGRAEAEKAWTSPKAPPSPPTYTLYTSAANNSPNYPPGDSDQNEYRYCYLKRYIDRPSYYLVDVSPDSQCSIFTPTNVHGSYSAAVTLISNSKVWISITDH